MLENVTVYGAFAAGLVSFVSPCVLPLVPPYLGYLAGVSLEELSGKAETEDNQVTRRVFFSALVFVLGFSTIFILMGATATFLGQAVRAYLPILQYVAGAAIILMGLHFLGIFRIGLLYREARIHVDRKPAGPLGAYVIGLAFGFAWTPCIGPILATVLTFAANQATVESGVILLGSYALGLGVPFLAAALFSGPFLNFMRRFRKHQGAVEKTMGGVLVVTGIVFLTGHMALMSYWLLETFPVFQNIG